MQGTDYNAGVEFSGGAVVLIEEDGFLAHRLNQAVFLASARRLSEAYLDLREKIELALYDIAEMVDDYDAFKRDLRRFFHDADPWPKRCSRRHEGRSRTAKSLTIYP